MPRKTVVALIVVALGVALAGCGGGGGGKPEPTAPFHTYVALGDSYTAAPLVPSPQGNDGGCFRSTHNYPSLVAAALHVPDFRDRSCGGATTADLRTAQRSGIPAQIDAVDARTDLVTLSIGGNDDSVFGRLVLLCSSLGRRDPGGAPCTAAAAQQPGNLDRIMAGVRARIVDILEQVRRRAPKAKVLVVGYPLIFPQRGSCSALPFAPGDYPFAVAVNRKLDASLRRAAATTRSTFVDVWTPSLGHDICSSSPWVNGGTTRPDQAAAFHPFAVEQRAVAQLVLSALGRPTG